MKILYFLPFIGAFLLNSLNAQNTIHTKPIYRIWVKEVEPKSTFKGYLREIGDSSIFISKSITLQNTVLDINSFEQLEIRNIDEILARRRNKVGFSIMIGAISGIVIGTLIGLNTTNYPSCGHNNPKCIKANATLTAVAYSGLGGELGIGIGALIGSVRFRVPINRSINNYNKRKDKLKKFILN